MAVRDEPLHGAAAVAFPAQHIQEHGVRDSKPRDQPLGLGVNQAQKRLLVPIDEILLRRLAFDWFSFGAFSSSLRFSTTCSGAWATTQPRSSNPLRPARPPDLVEIARAQDPGFLPVKLAEPGEEHGADGHVDADAQGVGAADHFEQAFLSQLLDQYAVLGQQPGVVQADAVFEPFPDFRSVRTGELEPFERRADGVLLFARAHVDAGEILRALRRFELGEMHDINRAFAFSRQAFQRLGERQFPNRHIPAARAGPSSKSVTLGRPLRLVSSFSKKLVSPRVADINRKRVWRQSQQRHLPGHASLAVGIVMEFVHNDFLDVGLWAFAQGDVGQDFRRAAEDGRLPVDGGVAGAQPDVFRAELAAQSQPLLIDQGFDRAACTWSVCPAPGL